MKTRGAGVQKNEAPAIPSRISNGNDNRNPTNEVVAKISSLLRSSVSNAKALLDEKIYGLKAASCRSGLGRTSPVSC